MRRNCGFTLIEILIAALIFSIVSLSIYAAFRSGLAAYQKIDTASEIYRVARIILNKIDADLKNSFVREDSAGNSGFAGAAESLEFFSIGDNICRVKYAWDSSSGTLRRSVVAGLDTLNPQAEVSPEDLAAGIEKITFEYAYLTGDDNQPCVWQSDWPTQDDKNIQPLQQKALPSAVRLNFTLGGINFTKVIALPMAEEAKAG
jgi:prepilin-type N-terminal cleavage/methylation domain-containing protein